MLRKLTNEENEKLTWQDLEYGQKTEETCKMRHTHSRTCNMVRKLTNEEIENLTWQDQEYGEKKPLKNMENDKCTLQDLAYGEKTEKRGK